MCGQTCCASTERCCGPASEHPLCIPADGCCSEDDCAQGECIDHRCEGEPLPFLPAVSLALGMNCLAQVTLTNFPSGIDLPAVRLFGKTSSGAPSIELEQMSNIPIPFLGTLVYTFGFDLGAGGYIEVTAEVDTGNTIYSTNAVPVDCIRPTPTPTATQLPDPRVTLSVSNACELSVALTGFGAGTDVNITVNGRNSRTFFPFELPILVAPSVTVGDDGSITFPPMPIDPVTLNIDEIQARVSFGRDRYASGWVPVQCQLAHPIPTRTPRSRRR